MKASTTASLKSFSGRSIRSAEDGAQRHQQELCQPSRAEIDLALRERPHEVLEQLKVDLDQRRDAGTLHLDCHLWVPENLAGRFRKLWPVVARRRGRRDRHALRRTSGALAATVRRGTSTYSYTAPRCGPSSSMLRAPERRRGLTARRAALSATPDAIIKRLPAVGMWGGVSARLRSRKPWCQSKL